MTLSEAAVYIRGNLRIRLFDPSQCEVHLDRYRLIDLFAGCGGLTLGFMQAREGGFVPVFANDFDDHAAASYNANFSDSCERGDIVDLLEEHSTAIPEADVVIGGPPCQGFSLLNKNRDVDPRKHLWKPFLNIVEQTGVSVFVMENVPPVLVSPEFGAIAEHARRIGFRTLATGVLNAADYGVPQVRKRAFIVGCRHADPREVFPPLKTHYNPRNGSDLLEYVASASPWRTVRDAIADLPPPEGTDIRQCAPPLDLHFGRQPTEMSRRRYRAIPKEGMNRFDLQRRAPDLVPACWIRKTSGGTDLLGRLWWDRPAFTIRTEFFKPEKGRYLHPKQHRPITHREAARLQGFPDDFAFKGSKIEIAKQIGNAVPPGLAAAIATCVLTLLDAR